MCRDTSMSPECHTLCLHRKLVRNTFTTVGRHTDETEEQPLNTSLVLVCICRLLSESTYATASSDADVHASLGRLETCSRLLVCQLMIAYRAGKAIGTISTSSRSPPCLVPPRILYELSEISTARSDAITVRVESMIVIGTSPQIFLGAIARSKQPG